MDELKDVIARNLIRLRQAAGLTQLQLAQMLNYSDKAVSKWERGESIPDLRVLIRLAEIYHIKVDDIISEQPEMVVKPKLHLKKKRVFITLLSFGLVWFVATVVFAVLYFLSSMESYAYLAFVAAPFVSGIVLVVFSAMWGNRITNALSVSLVLWSIPLILHLYLAAFGLFLDKAWMFYVIAAPFQILIVLWFAFRKVK